MAETTVSQNWEYNGIGEFLLQLNLNSILTAQNDWRISTKLLKRKFDEFLTQDSITKKKTRHRSLRALFQTINKNLDIALFLKNTNFGKAVGDDCIAISSSTFCNYRDQVLLKYDAERKLSQTFVSPYLREQENADVQQITDALVLLALHEIDEDAEWFDLKYCGSALQSRSLDFIQSNYGCYICQHNFCDHAEYKQHVLYHNKHSNFEYMQTMNKLEIHFDLTYSICKKSHYFCFDLGCDAGNIVVEKFIIVQETFMHDIPLNSKDYIYVDSHLLSAYSELAIVIVYHGKNSPTLRFAEEHHFFHNEPLPAVNFNIAPHKLDYKSTFRSRLKLDEYQVPKKVLEAVQQHQSSIEILSALSSDLLNYIKNDNKMTSASYINVFSLLLQIEDAYLLQSYKQLTQKNVKFQTPQREQTFRLKSNGCDIQPSPADRVVLLTADNEAIHGSIYNIENGLVTVALDKRAVCTETYTVAFKPLRLTQRYQYDALYSLARRSKFIAEFLFPGNLPCELPCEICPELYNKSIYDNPEQLQAVTNIVSRSSQPVPYLIWGPPGTGKTTVLVECIYQLYKRDEETRILILAGSNSACNSVALPLCQIFEKENINDALIRVFSRTQEKNIDKVDEVLLESSNLLKDHFLPSVDSLHTYRIIVCTLSMMGRLNLGLLGQGDKNSFTHIFIDEAAACTEPETLCGFAYALQNCAKQTLILAGDPKQLGAVLRCEASKQLGLGLSLMERLLALDCYAFDADGNYNTSIQTQLRRNYRSHPEIVRLYNSLYYNDRLIAKAPLESVSFGTRWHRSCNTNFPIIFHAVRGIRGKCKTSSFNSQEVDAVLNYVQDLMFFGNNGKKVVQADIGIVSPYKEQCRIIESELKRRNWMQIEVGTTELYQGREKLIIIASFVRSATSELGFLVEPKRFNVLLSRAKALLILIGNPTTLSLNADMARVIDECRLQNTFVETTVVVDKPDESEDAVHQTNLTMNTKITHTKTELLNMNQKCTFIQSTLYNRLKELKINKNIQEMAASTEPNTATLPIQSTQGLMSSDNNFTGLPNIANQT